MRKRVRMPLFSYPGPGGAIRRLAIAGALLPFVLPGPRAADVGLDFDRHVRPLLSENCFACHGPDAAKRRAELRLDRREGIFRERQGRRPVVAGDPAASEILRRLTSPDPEVRMPPPASGKALRPGDIELVRRWIEAGAPWREHWAFVAPFRPPLPAARDGEWPRGGVDRFILARLEDEGLAPAPEAARETLARRLGLDLTGLPPSLEDLDAYLADAAPDACERVVERLLASPRLGERLAGPWLDAARYADTSGYQTDGPRYMWRWRDWVIDALNRNLPFDAFTVEQIAGDLLPGATLEQRIATGFNRNHRGNAEGGIIAEEYLVEYVADRVDTTATVWLGLTLGCARCHDHKYDPLRQEEFYGVFAYFNNVPEHGRAIKVGNSPPTIAAPTEDDRERLRAVAARLRAAEEEAARREPELAAAQAAWEETLASSSAVDHAPGEGLLVHFLLDGGPADATGRAPPGSPRGGEPEWVSGRLGGAARFDGSRFVEIGDIANFGYFDAFSCGAWISLDGQEGGGIVSRMGDSAEAEGHSFGVVGGRLQVNLVKRWLDDAIRVETEERLEPGGWHHVLMTYDGTRLAAGVRVHVDGRQWPCRVLVDELNQTFTTTEPLRLGARGTRERFRGAIDDVRIYSRELTEEEAGILATPEPAGEIASVPRERRTGGQASKLRACFLAAAPAAREAERRLVELRREKRSIEASIPTVMVMQEMDAPRDTFVLVRGAYDRPGKKVEPGVPSCLPPLPAAAPRNRLGLARWLVDPANPLVARVAVNRSWQMLFGAGLVRTAEDFGSQGERPSHPELLDWLAVEFIRGGWDVKALLRRLATSAVYRQASAATPGLLERDPENRLLARGPRFRLPAAAIRDAALAASGLLVERLGGPSVKPYQPAGLWEELCDQQYVEDRGEDLYRRSLYTFWKRTVAPPSMVNFDAAGREACSVRPARTNTPLQALTLLNDVTFVEAARVLAERAMREGGTTPAARLATCFRRLTARRPGAAEARVLEDGYRAHLERFRGDGAAAAALLAAGTRPRDPALDAAEVAALAVMASLILNLDETVTRE